MFNQFTYLPPMHVQGTKMQQNTTTDNYID